MYRHATKKEGLSLSLVRIALPGVRATASSAPRLSLSAGRRPSSSLRCGRFPSLDLSARLIYPASEPDILGNFITADGEYLMTSDGRIFLVVPENQ